MTDTVVKINSTPITIKGNCTICNYKPDEKKPDQFIYANINDGKIVINQSNSNSNNLSLTNEQYSIFSKIASASDNDSEYELTYDDIIQVGKKKNKNNFGLDSSYVVKSDTKAGVVSVYKKFGDKLKTILRINLEQSKNDSSTKSKNENQPDKARKYASLAFNRYELGQRCYLNKLNIAPNTLIETKAGSFLVDDKGQAFKLNRNGNWEKCNSLEDLSKVASKGLASFADNTGEKNGDLTLDEKDFDIAKKMSDEKIKSDLIDRFNYYNGEQVYNVYNLHFNDTDQYGNKIKNKNIEINIGSKAFKDIENVRITFNVDSKNIKKEKTYTKGDENAKEIYSQIHGPSLNKNTFKLINSLSDQELLAAIKIYNKHKIVTGTKTENTDGYTYSYDGGYRSATHEVPVYNKCGIFQNLNDEWGIGIKEIWPIICRATRGLSEFHRSTTEYKNLLNILKTVNGNSNKNFDDDTIIKINNAFAECSIYRPIQIILFCHKLPLLRICISACLYPNFSVT